MDVPILRVAPQRTKSKRSLKSSKEPRGGDNSIPASPSTPNTNPRTSVRPGLATRISSAPLLPRTSEHTLSVDEDLDVYSPRDSIASIKDDPFFRNYQSPQSISLARELRSATNSERMREERAAPNDPPPRSAKRPSVDNSVNLPVC